MRNEYEARGKWINFTISSTYKNVLLNLNTFIVKLLYLLINKYKNNVKTLRNMALQVGDKAPSVLGLNQDGKEIKLADYAGKKVVLYFYPKDNTPGCTAQACSLRDGFDELQKEGYEIIGVSTDSATSHQKFISKQNLPFNLIADTDKKLSETFGTWGEKSMYGKQYMGMFRTTFLIDKTGTITRIILPKEVNTKEHASQILKG